MRKNVALLLVLILTALKVITFLPVKAESRTIVVPDDYSTISEAIRNANKGDIIFVKKGTYEEKTLEMNKPLSLIGEGAEFTKINLDPPLIEVAEVPSWIDLTPTPVWIYDLAVKVDADDFKLQGLTINTTGDVNKAGGEISITGNRAQIIGNIIMTRLLVNGSYWNIEENTFLEDITVAGSHSNVTENILSGTLWASGSYLNISSNNKTSSNEIGKDTGTSLEGSFCVVYGNIFTAQGLEPAIRVSGDGNAVAKNIVDRSDVGIEVDGSDNIVCANEVTNCQVPSFTSPRAGVALRVSGNNTVYANYLGYSTWGVDVNAIPEISLTLTSTFYHNNFVGNTHQVAALSHFTYGNDSFDNGIEGNYWSDYIGSDADGDGVGDTPYVIDANRQDRYPLMAPFDVESVTVDLSDWMSPPSVQMISPENTTYTSVNLSLEFTVNKQTSWMGYSLDGEANITLTGNTTLPNLPYGSHNLTVYATDMVGHEGASEAIHFAIAEPLPTMLVVAASGISVAVIGAGLLVYLKKRKR